MVCAASADKQRVLSGCNIIEDKVEMPQPMREMGVNGEQPDGGSGRLYVCSLYFNQDCIVGQPILDVETAAKVLQKAESEYDRVVLTDREADFAAEFSGRLTNIQQEEFTFRGFRFGYLNRVSAFQPPVRDDSYNENLLKSRFLLACVSTAAEGYDEQLFQLYKISQAFTKLYTVVLLKDCTNAEQVEAFKQKFSFFGRMNVLNYQHGLFKRFQRYDGVFDQLYFVFSGAGEVVFKCNFADEFMEYARSNQS